MNKSQLYLTTGEFAKLCHTTKHTLFHYCDIGLFEPVYTDENGYRFYHVLQYDTFLTIAQLRTLGMPLSEIKSYLAERSPQRMVELYQEQETLISKQISQLKQIKGRISKQKKNILQALMCTEEYDLEEQEQCSLLCSEKILQADDYAMTRAIGELIHSANGETSSNTLGMICALDDAICSDQYPCWFYVNISQSRRAKCLVKSAGTYLSTYHRGEYETLQRSYQGIVSYADRHQMELEKWVYAEIVIGDWAVCRPQDYIIKVSVKVKKN